MNRTLKLFLLFFTATWLLNAEEKVDIHPPISKISKRIKQQMINRGTYKKGCPVPIKDLRYLRITYLGFDGEDHVGEMIVHKSVAREVYSIFQELYQLEYPIRRMELISKYGGNDTKSMEADNTSAFNCRKMTGNRKKWSRHAYGKAIDINPLENPYISRSGRVQPKKSAPYKKRVRNEEEPSAESEAMLLPNDASVDLFRQRGWRWGGDWKSVKDYQHFEYKER